MSIQHIIFYLFSLLMLGSATAVITARNPVHSVLFLVLTFFAASAIWIFLQSEFLALALIFVYVGAVMTLFLFVVMMLNIDLAPLRKGFIRYLPLGLLVIILLMAFLFIAIKPGYTNFDAYKMVVQPADYSNVKALGSILYTDYVYPFELAAVLLLVAIIAAITLTFRGRRNRKLQQINEQVRVRKEDRIKIIKMPAGQ